MLWISHRGESVDAPENTLAAFKLSLERNTDGMECDVHLTADDKLVVCHDFDTLRTCGVSMRIEESNYSELQNLVANNKKIGFDDARIPLFGETIQYLGNRYYYIEIKENNPAVIDAVVAELNKAKVPQEQIVIISFHADIVKAFKQKYPEIKALFLVMFKVNPNGTWSPTAKQLIEMLKDQGADGVDIQCNLNFITQQYVDEVKSAGFTFAAWTIDDAWLARRFIEMGADVITSNRAAAIRDQLEVDGLSR